MVRFAITPPPPQGTRAEPFASQVALSRVHPCLVPLERTPSGCAPQRGATRDWFELPAKRGLAGYGLARALRMLLDVLTGLTALEDTKAAHGKPFVHGELVPAMIRVDPQGVARLVALAPRHWSAAGTLPAQEHCGHLAPERLLGDPIDARADVFSAGVLLWEALAGGRLFERDSVDQIVMRLMGEKVTLPQLPPELSWAAPLKAVAMCALSVDPQLRFANCAELTEAIEDIARDRLATHADVAQFFGSREASARRSSIAPLGSAPTHNSSLSALVAPAHSPSVPAANSSEASAAESRVPASQMNRRVWGAAAISCLVTALAVGAIARYNGREPLPSGASQGVPVLGQSAPSVTPRPSSPPMPSVAATAAGPALEPALSPVAPIEASTADTGKPFKSQKGSRGGKAPRGPGSKPSLPSKTAHPPDRAAAKYGI